MHPFFFGGYVIDTPGIRGFGLIQMEKEELSHYFREIFAASSACQFNNCTHLHEPGCAVKEQVSEGDRKSTRLNSSHVRISYAVFCLKKKKNTHNRTN